MKTAVAACVLMTTWAMGCGSKGAGGSGPASGGGAGSPAVTASARALAQKPLNDLRADARKAAMKDLESMSKAYSEEIVNVEKRLKDILGDNPKGAAIRDGAVQAETMELTRTLSALAEREKIIVDELIRKGKESFGK
jgi:hypothetical protein